MARSLIVVLLGLILLSWNSAYAAEGDTAAARALATRGIEAYQAEKYEEAVDLLERAETVLHAPTHLLYLARSHQKLGHPVDAYELYNRVIRERLDDNAPAAFVRAQEVAREEISGLDSQIAFVTISLDGMKADQGQILVDGKEISSALVGVEIPVNPGDHVVELRSETHAAKQQKFSVKTAGHEKVTLKARPVDGGSDEAAVELDSQDATPSKLPAYVALGVGAAGLIAGGVFTGLHFGQKSKAKSLFEEAGCEQACFESEQDDINDYDERAATFGTVSLIGYGVGAAGVAAGVTLLLLNSGKAARPEDSAGVQPVFGWGYLGARGSF